MLEFRLVQGSILRKVVEAIRELVVNVNFDCTSSGFSLQAMDHGNAALVVVFLRANAFEYFNCDRTISIGIKLNNMPRILRSANNDTITVRSEDDTDILTFKFESPAQDKISIFEMKVKDIEHEHFNIPNFEVEYHAFVKMPSADFKRICRDLGHIGDTVTISVTEEGVKFSTKGDIGTVNMVCKRNTSVDKPEEATEIEMTKAVRMTYVLTYLISFTRATPLSDTVTIMLAQDQPVGIEYKIPDMGYVRFNLAPAIEQVEEEAKPGEGVSGTKPEDKVL